MNNYILTKDGNFYSVDNNTDNELYHYGVLGMKWGVRKNPAKAYSKSLKTLSRKTSKYEKARSKATEARSEHKKSADIFNKMDEVLGKSRNRLNSAKARLSELENTDTSYMRRKDRKYFNSMIDDARKDVDRKTDILTNQNIKRSKALDETRILNNKATKAERKASKSKQRLEKYTAAMNKTFKDLDASTIEEGRALFEQAIKKR